jgi:hypothetical protein
MRRLNIYIILYFRILIDCFGHNDTNNMIVTTTKNDVAIFTANN